MESNLLTHRLSAIISKILENQMKELIQNENVRIERLHSIPQLPMIIFNEKNESGHVFENHEHGSLKSVAKSQIEKSGSIKILNHWTNMVDDNQNLDKKGNQKILHRKRQNKVNI